MKCKATKKVFACFFCPKHDPNTYSNKPKVSHAPLCCFTVISELCGYLYVYVYVRGHKDYQSFTG